MILKKMKYYFEEELGNWELGQFEAPESANTFKRFYSELAGGLQQKLQRAPNWFASQENKNYYAKTSCNVSNIFEFSNVSEEDIKKILISLDTSKVTGMDQIPAKFLRDGAELLTFPLRNLINLSIKLSTFPDECKTATLKPIFKKGARTDPKNYRLVSFFPLV